MAGNNIILMKFYCILLIVFYSDVSIRSVFTPFLSDIKNEEEARCFENLFDAYDSQLTVTY
jgi:hypothetical protein